MNPDGGFRGRSPRSDLYYAVFALAGLRALEADAPWPQVREHLARFGGGEALDLVHLSCLARCWALLPRPATAAGRLPAASRRAMLGRLAMFRSGDGGFDLVPAAPFGSLYGCFVALGAYQDLRAKLPDAAGLARCARALQTADGAFANQQGLASGLTSATAAAVVVLRELGRPVGPQVGPWLLARAHPEGGFLAVPGSPMPDLLSTATALQALATLGAPMDGVRQACVEFIESLWSDAGGFHGTWADDGLDAEYTWYGLMALGLLDR
jgi:prenyltransferase beta subunit